MDADTFASGPQNASFQFTVQVNDTNPIFFYCGVATHCEKGMFGIVNPPDAGNNPTSVASMIPSIVNNNPYLSDMWSYTQNVTAGTSAENWGDSYDMSNIPVNAQSYYVENVMLSRVFLATNPGMSADDIGAAMSGGSDINFPTEFITMLSSSAPSSGSTSTPSTDGYSGYGSSSSPPAAAAAAGSGTIAASNAQSTQPPTTNGARSVASSGAVVALVAVAATFFAL